MKANIENKNISIILSEDEALVLLEWLHRFNEEERPALFQHQAEERVLFDLETEIEKIVSGTFSDGYSSLLAESRERIRDKE